MPEPDGFIHGGGEDEEVVGPGDVQQVARVPCVRCCGSGSFIASLIQIQSKHYQNNGIVNILGLFL